MTLTTELTEGLGDGDELRRADTISVAARYCGLPGLAQGGYTSGLVAEAVGTPAVEVNLRRPVPVGRELALHATAPGRAELREGETLLSEGVATDLEIDVPEPPSAHEARVASGRFPAFSHHPVPGCFVCGTDHPKGRGLKITPGPVGNRPLVAATWTPGGTGSVPQEVIWAAFDCTQLWALIIHQESRPGERAVTARVTTRIDRPVARGVEHVLLGWPLGRKGDVFRAGSALLDPEGSICAIGVQTALRAKWGVPLGGA